MSSKPDAWFAFYPGDYLRDTMHLTTEQHGAYLLLIMSCFTRGGTLPADDETLAAIARLPMPRWLKMAPVLRSFFKSDPAGLHHSRVDSEIERARRISERRREAGSKGGRPRKSNRLSAEKQNETQPQPQPQDSHPSDGSPRPPLVDVSELQTQMAEAREAGGEALASMATHPGMASIAPLRALLAGDSPCDWTADVLPAIRQAAAWHMAKGGAGSMKTWTAVARFAAENRDQRLSGPATTGNGNERRPSARRAYDDRQANYARAFASPGGGPE